MLREAGFVDETVEKESNLKTIKADRAQGSNDSIEYNAPKKKKTMEIEEEGLDYSATKKKKFGLNAPADDGESYYQDPSGKKRRQKKIVNEEEEEHYEEYVDSASGIKKRVPVFSKEDEDDSEDMSMEAGELSGDDLDSDDEVESYGFGEDLADDGDLSEIDSILSAALGGGSSASSSTEKTAPTLAEKIAANSQKAREEEEASAVAATTKKKKKEASPFAD